MRWKKSPLSFLLHGAPTHPTVQCHKTIPLPLPHSNSAPGPIRIPTLSPAETLLQPLQLYLPLEILPTHPDKDTKPQPSWKFTELWAQSTEPILKNKKLVEFSVTYQLPFLQRAKVDPWKARKDTAAENHYL